MRRTASAVVLLIAACAPGVGGAPASPTAATPAGVGAFPVTVEADNGAVEVESRPARIVSLSATATEMLFEIGAGPQVAAVDDRSNHPSQAPMTDLSGITPNLEAILSYEPDLVVIAFDPGGLIAGLWAVGVPVLSFGAATTLDGALRQMEALGAAAGASERAALAVERMETGLREAVAAVGTAGKGVTYYHEIDSTFYTADSSTFVGRIYGLFGMVNIADGADPDGAASGFPQLAGEHIVTADPDMVFLANAAYGESAETVAARPGWSAMKAVREGDIVELDSDVASRWGPRVVELAQAVAVALNERGDG